MEDKRLAQEQASFRIKSRIALAWVSLWTERVWNGLWPLQAAIAAFLAVAFSGLLPALGFWLHVLILAGSLGGLAWLFWQKRWAWRTPSWTEASRRLERDSGVSHRPLHGLDDQPLNSDPAAMALWEAHQRQLAARLAALKAKPPKSDLPRLDRFAVRAGALLALVVALFLVGGDALYRFGETFRPSFASGPTLSPVVDVWVEPPAYTNAPPVFAQPGMAELAVPIGSTLVARVSNSSTPALTLDAETHALEEESPGRHSLKLEIQAGEALSLQDGTEALGNWALRIVPDLPPTATMSTPPSGTERFATRVDYKATDDYGVVEAWAELHLLDQDGNTDGTPMRLSVLLGDQATPSAEGAIFQDLTPHRWAGRQVEVRVNAKDELGQQAVSEPARMHLPERIFQHPVAREIMVHRKWLDEGAEFLPLAKSLIQIAERPAAFDGDIVIFLGISAAHSRLRLTDEVATREQTRDSVRDLLWDMALRLEDGGLGAAEKALRAAQRALQEALARDASDEEIARLVEELRRALRDFARELAQFAEQAPEGAPAESPENMISGQDLEKTLDQIRELSRSGAKEAAQQLLSQMQKMLEGLRNPRMSQEQREQAAEMMKRMNELEGLRERQQKMLDQTFQQNQQRQKGQSGPPRPGSPRRPGQQGQPGEGEPMGELAELQELLRRDLGELMRQLGEGQTGGIPKPLQDAEQAMRDAGKSLQKGDGPGALGSEGEALQHLQGAAQQMANQFARQMGRGQGQSPGNEDGEDGQGQSNRDPLGREGVGGQAATVGPKVPKEFDIQRARTIRDELYRRSADPSRPAVEQEYLKRLLERF